MTTIAYKNGIIAADSQGTVGDIIYTIEDQKIIVDGDRVFALCGNFEHCRQFMKGWPDGEMPGGECSGFVLDGVILYRAGYEEDGRISRQVQEFDKHWAFGTGMEYALAAMDMGASAEEAVKIAIGRDVYSGGEVHTIEVKGFQST